PGDVQEPQSAARLRDRDRATRVYVALPEDRASALRHDPDRLCARPAAGRAQEPQDLAPDLPRQGHLLRGRDERDPRRARRGAFAAADDGERRVLGARRHHDDGAVLVREEAEAALTDGGYADARRREEARLRFRIADPR